MNGLPARFVHQRVTICPECGRDWLEGDQMPAICERNHGGYVTFDYVAVDTLREWIGTQDGPTIWALARWLDEVVGGDDAD